MSRWRWGDLLGLEQSSDGALSIARPDAPKAEQCSALRFIDLFCGIGGFRLAFERAGARCVFSSDWDKFSRQTLRLAENLRAMFRKEGQLWQGCVVGQL